MSQRPDVELASEFGGLSAQSPGMQAILGLLGRYASTDVSMTLIGETGTGKEVWLMQFTFKAPVRNVIS